MAMPEKRRIRPDDPCFCGSGKKFRDCCMPDPQFVANLLRKQQELLQAQEARKEVFGELKPGVHANWQGYKFVASGHTIHYQKEAHWKTPADFLRSYLLRTLGLDWVRAELAKPLGERHLIMKWEDSIRRLLEKQVREPNGLIGVVASGPMSAFMLLAHDLYALNHHAALKEQVVRRLKVGTQFYGARHELFAAAVCIRAGFDIEHEDESDKERKHTEFIAVHERTGQRIQVEAKHREPTQTGRGQADAEDLIAFKMNRLLRNALKKPLLHPYVLFVELSIPPVAHIPHESPWFRKFLGTMKRLRDANDGRSPFNLVVLTNFADHYGPDDQPAPQRYGYTYLEPAPRIGATHLDALEGIRQIVERYGSLPATFDEL